MSCGNWLIILLTWSSHFLWASGDFPAPVIFNITVDAEKVLGILPHFWESTGMCPPLPHQNASNYYLSQDMMHNLIHIGSVPHSGIKQVRMHWLLDMVTYDEDKQAYNFTNLDTLFQFMRKYNLNPGFELMGSPSNKFTNFDYHDQVMDWMKLVTELGKRYLDMFGIDVVSQWNFETWNEPDHKDFDNVVMSVEGFLRYYDACSEGLKVVDPALKFGGPGGSCRKESFSQRCWALLEHCTTGRNYITGEKGSRLDYISMHKKGGGSSSYIIESEYETIAKIHDLYPTLRNTPIYNDEADPMVGWSKPYPWRADSTYAAIVAKIIAQHLYGFTLNKTTSDHILYSLLSNDNGFLNYSPHYFTQRTLNARFQMNNTSPQYVHLVKKPVYAAMVLLSKLGHFALESDVVRLYNKTTDDRVGVIASLCQAGQPGCANQEITLLTYCSNDTSPMVDDIHVFINFENVKPGGIDVRIMTCKVDANTEPSQIWKDAGSPDFPGRILFEKMHQASEPRCSGPYTIAIDSHKIGLQMEMRLPGLYLHQICWKPTDGPKPPTLLSVTNITSAQILIAWSDAAIQTKCIKTYFIQKCFDSACKSTQEVNTYRVLSNSFVYMSDTEKDKDVHGSYRVAVVDFWDRYGPFSNIIVYP